MATKARTVLDLMASLGSWFKGDSWIAWRVVLKALFGLPIKADADRALFKKITGRSTPPSQQVSEGWLICGRRAGKSIIAALVAVFLACFRDYSDVLAPGERGTISVIASDRRQARVIFRYIVAFLELLPSLAAMIERHTADNIDLSNAITIEVHTASFRSVRGYTLVACICDEVAFWPTDTSSNPDSEVLNAIRPATATVPNALLLVISSPYARKGELYRAYRDHFCKESDVVLVVQADTATMNPLVPASVIKAAYHEDPASAAAEYGGEFRRDVETLIAREVIEACVVVGRYELVPVSGVRYEAFVDPSGGSQDSMTLAIAHHEDGTTVLDAVREVLPPFSPEQVVEDFSVLLRRYGLAQVTGDRFGGLWPRERFTLKGIDYRVAEQSKSELYKELLPLLNSGSLAFLDNARVVAQLCALERRTARGGKDSVDHPPQGKDDLINAAAGACVLSSRVATRQPLRLLNPGVSDKRTEHEQRDDEIKERAAASVAMINESVKTQGYWWPN